MIPELIGLLQQKLGSTLKTVEYAPDMEPIDNYDKETPAAVFIYGDRDFSPATDFTTSVQENTTQVNVALIAAVDDIYTIETEIIESLMGYTHNENHGGLYAMKCTTEGARENYFTRRIVFGASNHVGRK